MTNHLTKFNLFLIGAFLIFGSCAKNSDNEPTPKEDTQLYDVKFKVRSFTQQIVPIASDEPLEGLGEIDESIYKIKYLIFDYMGNNVESIVQHKSDPNFGSHTLKLATGVYKIAVWATAGDVRESSSPKASFEDAILYAAAYFGENENNAVIHDAFYKEYDFTVGEADVDNEIILERETAKLELKIIGDMPNGAKTLRMSYTSYVGIRPASYEYGNNNSDVNLSEFTSLEDYADTDGGYTFYGYVLPKLPGEPFMIDVSLSILAENGDILTYKLIEDVEVVTNKKTILTGPVSDGNESLSNTSIGIDTTWDDDHNIISF